MRLQEIYLEVDKTFMIDEKLKLYFHEDHIEFVDYTSPIYQDGKLLLNEFNGLLFTIYINKNDRIVSVEHNSLKMITPVNIHLYGYLISLIGKKIDDFRVYLKMSEKEQAECLTIG